MSKSFICYNVLMEHSLTSHMGYKAQQRCDATDVVSLSSWLLSSHCLRAVAMCLNMTTG